MAENRPMGTAISIAMPEIIAVPRNSGTAPKLPEDPTWSARIAVCGLQTVPNRNSCTDTERKNRMDSYTTDSTMPTVTKTASDGAGQQCDLAGFLDRIARTQFRPDARPRHQQGDDAQHQHQSGQCLRRELLAGARIPLLHSSRRRDTESAGIAPGNQVAHVVHEQPELRGIQLRCVRQSPAQQGGDDAFLEAGPDDEHQQAGHCAPQCRQQAVVAGQ